MKSHMSTVITFTEEANRGMVPEEHFVLGPSASRGTRARVRKRQPMSKSRDEQE